MALQKTLLHSLCHKKHIQILAIDPGSKTDSGLPSTVAKTITFPTAYNSDISIEMQML